jgi:hypothetical protein
MVAAHSSLLRWKRCRQGGRDDLLCTVAR